MKHMLGPYHAEDCGKHLAESGEDGWRAPEAGDVAVIAPSGVCVAIVWGGLVESVANAALQIAAPDLLAACKDAELFFVGLTGSAPSFLTAAIAKAESRALGLPAPKGDKT